MSTTSTKNFIKKLENRLNSEGGCFSGIYLILERDTQQPYVGKAKEITKRILQHIRNTQAKSGIDRRIAELGPEAFEYKILEKLPTATDLLLLMKEEEWINRLNSKRVGHNLTRGNANQVKKWLASIAKYVESYTVSVDMVKLIAQQDPALFNRSRYTLIHEFDNAVKNRLDFEKSSTNPIFIQQIHGVFSKRDSKNKLVEDTEALADYINKELDYMKTNNQLDLGVVIANVPYGTVGAEIMSRIVKDFTFDCCYSLEPGNDYFTKANLYKHIDPTFKPIICRNGCFKDASQTTVITKLQKEPNNLSELEARIMLHIDTEGNTELSTAITEYLLKANAFGTLKFSQRSDIDYSTDIFVFNPGAFDIHHGYFAVYDSKKSQWTSSTNYNIFKIPTTGHKNSPSSKVRGCDSFKKLIYSKLGLQFLKVLFQASPEGWGFLNGFFVDIDYSTITNFIDFFNKIGLSATSQTAFLKAMSSTDLTAKEAELITIVEEM
jgi:hypothetical protein